MKRYLLLLSAMIVAAITSCNKESELDSAIVAAASSQSPIKFSTYASSATATKATAVNTNDIFKNSSFDVAAQVAEVDMDNAIFTYDNLNYVDSYTPSLVASCTAVNYFNFTGVSYSTQNSAWESSSSMYWPNYSKTFYFAAYSPSSDEFKKSCTLSCGTDASANKIYSFSFPYTVPADIKSQTDIMYAMTSVDYLAPSDTYKYDPDTGLPVEYSYVTTGVGNTNEESDVNLHFKHALTQIVFTATKDAAIDVYVKSITICNVYNSGTFTATAVTDDVDANATTNPTVGDDGGDGDKVNADNFGAWVVDYEGSWVLESEDSTTATAGGGGFSAMSHYSAELQSLTVNQPSGESSIKLSSGTTQLSSTTEALLLMPQALTAWEPSTSVDFNYCGAYVTGQYAGSLMGDGTYSNPSMDNADRTVSYLAIKCEIYHAGVTDYGAVIHDGYLFIPFETKNIAYSGAGTDNQVVNADKWLPGYKITYCLNFGGGYVVEEGKGLTLPEPGCVPDTKTLTLREITYTATTDAYSSVDVDQSLLDNSSATTTGS